MSISLLKKSLCQDTSNYEGLLASLSIIKGLLDCDENGNVSDGPAKELLLQLFEYGEDGNVLWFSANGLDKEQNPISGPDGVELNTSSGPYSCFKNTEIYYYGKSCSMDKCLWKPTVDNCLAKMFAYALIVLISDQYNPDTNPIPNMPFYIENNNVPINNLQEIFNSANSYSRIVIPDEIINSINRDDIISLNGWFISDIPFKLFIDILVEGIAEYLGGDPLEISFISFDVINDLIKAVCDLLKQKIQVRRTLKKKLLTLGKCDF